MIRGMQTAASAMKTQVAKQEVLEQNLLNLSVPGYKQEGAAIDGFSATISRVQRRLDETTQPVSSSRRAQVIGSLGVDTLIDRAYVDFRQGELFQTEQALDVALEGDGFLQVRTPAGDLYCRGGALFIDGSGQLMLRPGYPVLGTEGEVVPGEGKILIDTDGFVSVEGTQVARLRVVEFPAGTRMAKAGPGLYAPEDEATAAPMEAASTLVRAGFLEGSNVEETSTLSEMMLLLRTYQASQRMLQAQDDLLGKAVDEVGKV